MASLSGQNIKDTFQKLVQVEDGLLQDGIGGNLGDVHLTGSIAASSGFIGSLQGNADSATIATTATTASYALTASYLIPTATASYALTASYLSGSVNINTGSLVTTASFNQYTSSAATTGSNQFNGDQIITGSLIIGAWRFAESGSVLNVEKWNGTIWQSAGYFEV